ncbi:GDSL-type esterase/lipase family protein [Lysinibacillus sp. NPDC097287]|uniref:GDSL-type esterase/lipase family protein n=1 Tax=Lysinibacillus sp. NPDC097287 TaxID=3364144 RepID=UPI0037FD22CE
MNIWRVFLSCLIVLVLSGCTISIDEPDPQAERVEEQTDTEQETTNDVEQTQEEGEPSKNALTKFFEHFFDPSTEDSPSVDVEKAKPLHYLALGDSLTDGVGDEYNQDGYVGRLAGTLQTWSSISEVEIENRGKRGRRSDQLLKLIKKGHYDEELQQAGLISMTMGGNDVMKVVKQDLFNLKRDAFDAELLAYKERYSKIVDNIRAKNPTAPLLLIGFYNPFSIVTREANEFDTIITEWNRIIEEIASKDTNACYVSVEDLFDSNEELVYHTDFFHPNAKGYEKMTERIVASMELCGMEQKIKQEIGFEE